MDFLFKLPIASLNMASLVLIFGLLVIVCLLVKGGMDHFSLPPIIGYLLIGMLLSLADRQFHLLGESGENILKFFSAVGVVILLFRVGIESDLHALLKELPKAAVIWLPNMALSGIPAYSITHAWLGYGIVPSLFVGVAMTATSVGVSVAVWEESKKMKTKEGGLLLDTAELDDISGVALMALLFSIAPILKELGVDGEQATDSGPQLLQALASEAGFFLLKFLIFIAAILLIGRFLEKPLAHSAQRIGNKVTVLLFVVGFGLAISGTAGLIGLSLPIGALFAGLLLSRHRQDYGFKPFYQSLYLLFIPFFFIHIGFQIDPSVIGGSVWIGLALTAVAILGKIVGTGAVAWLFTGTYATLLIGASMAPRAEITMVIIQRGKQLGSWAMPEDLYAAMVFVSAATCLGTVLFLHWALRRWKK